MGFSWTGVTLATATSLLLLLAASPARALTFVVSFDEVTNEQLEPPLVGTGTIQFDGDPGDGSFAMSAFENLEMDFTLGADDFTLADLQTPASEVVIDITTEGARRRLHINNVNRWGSGPSGGAMDFADESNTTYTFLIFAPSAPGDASFIFSSNGSLYGDYFAYTATPEPSTAGLLASALTVALARRRHS